MLFELIGYTGSILVAISLMMKSLLRLRIINLVGASVFVLYGLLIGAEPVAFLNGLIMCIDVYYLVQMWRQKDYFTLLEVAHDSAYLRSFVDYYHADLAAIHPGYAHNPQAGHPTYFVLRNMVPAGLLVFNRDGADARVLVDYVIPSYRDFRVGRFIFDESAAHFIQQGIHRFVADPGKPRHAAYLTRMGFIPEGEMCVRRLDAPMLKDTRI